MTPKIGKVTKLSFCKITMLLDFSRLDLKITKYAFSMNKSTFKMMFLNFDELETMV